MSGLTPNQWTILEALKDGPRWIRTFQTAKPLLDDLIARGFAERCRPHMGRARNMVRLTALGCEGLEIDPASVPAKREEPKPNAKAFVPVLGSISSDASPATRKTCEAFARSIANGCSSREAVAELAALNDVQRPAIWKRLRAGGIIAPYAPSHTGGKGRPRGGGMAGYTENRRERSEAFHDDRRLSLEQPRVDRDPCPRCGVRGDIGCGHSQARLVV